MAVGASVIAYAASLIVQWAVLRTRLGTRISVEPMIQLGPWGSNSAMALGNAWLRCLSSASSKSILPFPWSFKCARQRPAARMRMEHFPVQCRSR